jgi:hypothetical protein
MVFVLSVLKFLVDPLNLVVFIGCGFIARSPVVAAVAGAVWGLVVLQLLGESVSADVRRDALAVYMVGGVLGVLAAYGVKTWLQRQRGR